MGLRCSEGFRGCPVGLREAVGLRGCPEGLKGHLKDLR